MIRILVVDDHPIVREGLVAVLEDLENFEVVGAAGSGAEAVALAERLRPDVALLDLEMPDVQGTETIVRLTQRVPETRILVFTAYAIEELVLDAIRAGAKGYLLKGATAEEIENAIRAVHGGASYLTPQVAAMVMAQVAAPKPARPLLTPRETEILRLIAEGHSSKQIAHALTIAEPTVKFHIRSLFNKLGADNRAQAVALALQQGLLQ